MNKIEVLVRQENDTDHEAVFNLIEEAFRNLEISDHTEHFLVNRLRKSDAFIPELSLVAEFDDKIVGHILLTKLLIKSECKEYPSLGLAPVSVLPTYQKQGIGEKLILEAHRVAQDLGLKSILLVGHSEYYPRFGYQAASSFGIQFPFEAPDEACLAVELSEGALKDVNGMVIYPSEFLEQE